MKALCAAAALLLVVSPAFAQSTIGYEIYAVRFAGPESAPLSEAAVGGDPRQTVGVCNMVWLLKGSNGKNILVDYNLDHLVAIPTYTFDAAAYVEAMKRMTTLVPNRDLIIPGHDAKVFEKFPQVADGVVRIR